MTIRQSDLISSRAKAWRNTFFTTVMLGLVFIGINWNKSALAGRSYTAVRASNYVSAESITLPKVQPSSSATYYYPLVP